MRRETIRPAGSRFGQPSSSSFEMLLDTTAKISVVIIAAMLVVAALYFCEVVMAPVALAVIVGLMFGPVAERVERLGMPSGLSAAMVVLLFIAIIAIGAALFMKPLSVWFDKLPMIWNRLKSELLDWQSLFSSIGDLRDQIQSIAGDESTMKVKVEDDGTVKTLAAMAPALLAQVLVFLASLYFFIATRERIRISILSMCISRRMRWRAAHVFRDVEWYVSRYLLSITAINIGLGAVVALAMMIAGVPSPLLWGLMAAVLNYIIYIGPAIMAVVLFAVGVATGVGPGEIILPAALYLGLNFLEAQFVTPHVLGRTLTLNPFVVFLSVAFWIWLWGPIGGLIAVPSLLCWHAILKNLLPRMDSVASGL